MLNPNHLKLYKLPLLLALLSIVLYALFAYDLVRTDYTKLIVLYTGLFILFYKLVQSNNANFKFLVGVAILFRLVFLFATPNLSQDFYRFIWDGRMILEGFNPYLFTPESFISVGKFPVAQAQELYKGMGMLNASHFTNYPPIKQVIFMIAGLFSGKDILGAALVLRLFIILADIGTLYIGIKLLKRLQMPVHHIFWYILNPFIIIELTGNLHFEGIMIFFLVLSLYLLHIGRWKTAAIVFALSVSVKLLPLLFLPLFFKLFVNNKGLDSTQDSTIPDLETPKYNFQKFLGFYSIVGITTLLLFLPFYSSEFVNNYAETVGLWFSTFEFNASLYYIAREIGYLATGYNQIAIIGKFIPILTIIMVLLFTFLRKNNTLQHLITSMLLAASMYFFMSTTIHPWYLATLLMLSVFTNYKFPLVWSFVIMLSYLAYANSENTENLWIIGLEYSVVYTVFFWELFKKKDCQIAVF
ncbi:mannosyltransferase [Gelidibacter salicanalis]|uniref:Mannosyltransferase n=1 Tax=Gelidibacter salicanalis TaxID=291193 RepID=A0A934NI94_9FLAO|nr:mannosyltransferase [Gelidibacter salicanalis]MBJ7880813.1 mannosyltransferase [Gelidibacter salicanalis]